MAKLLKKGGLSGPHTHCNGKMTKSSRGMLTGTIITVLIRSPYEFNSGEIYLGNPVHRACRIITAQPGEPPTEKPSGALEQQVLLNKHTDHS